MKPLIKSGKLTTGADCVFGDNVVIDVAEEVVLGDRCTIGDGAVFSGRRVEIGDDFFGYSWSHPCSSVVGVWRRGDESGAIMRGWLDVGSGRKDEEDAVLKVGARCTFHDNRIDLARRVTIGDDVGLSPEVAVYTHFYWQSWLEGFPCRRAPVSVGNRSIVYFRSVVLPGAVVEDDVVVGAQSVVSGTLKARACYAGDPVKLVSGVFRPAREERERRFREVMTDYQRSLAYRGISGVLKTEYPHVWWAGAFIDCEAAKLQGDECELTDDLRWFLFCRGIRVYTKRRFAKLGVRR